MTHSIFGAGFVYASNSQSLFLNLAVEFKEMKRSRSYGNYKSGKQHHSEAEKTIRRGLLYTGFPILS